MIARRRRTTAFTALAVLSTLATAGAAEVRVVETTGGHRLEVDGTPFRIRGAGLGDGPMARLAGRGANAVRTWRIPADPGEARALLDEAERLGLKVALGLDMVPPRRGFDYGDPATVAAQQARLGEQVRRWRGHPALLMWVVGNELNLHNEDPAVWDAVETVASMIHALDPDHPVTTTLAGFDEALIGEVKARVPSLDLLAVQLYGDLGGFPARLRAAGWDGPYVVTEWGPTGHWESPLTAWGAPIEDTATRKAELLLGRHAMNLGPDHASGLGDFVFLWGDKQERTPTWYGLLLPDGKATPAVDAMERIWTGRWPSRRAPATGPLRIDGQDAHANITLVPGQEVVASIAASDPDGDPLRHAWRVMQESEATSVGGDPEATPRILDLAFEPMGAGEVRFAAPTGPGHYRLFVEIDDGSDRAAYANLPFRVVD
ncbi:hypothetical protein H4F99_00620 [Lysobacter sp. SG-8]|uniref:Glycoside hydrolase family 2 catalytic domain-containing protein n=1 Tax=Marilutibacter penaei TaxID=2759900 RepID=A0A7W3YCR7_9GAMM|nr:glycoside hydrolase family 2 TIM barrel-domain containing protein [Lysobacter penaei]MBB1086984.1 hypothetical protein [Lysobacter penaei]